MCAAGGISHRPCYGPGPGAGEPARAATRRLSIDRAGGVLARRRLAIWEPVPAQAVAMPRGSLSSVVSAATVARDRWDPRARRRRRSRTSWLGAARRLGPIGIALPLAIFSGVLLWDGGPPGLAATGFHGAAHGHQEAARFFRCSGPIRITCVVDGDTFWYRGTKIRIADINTPELSEPECDYEADLAERATERLTALLNDGAFTLQSADRDRDRYGRALRVVTRGDASLGEQLVREGLAERWTGHRRKWC